VDCKILILIDIDISGSAAAHRCCLGSAASKQVKCWFFQGNLLMPRIPVLLLFPLLLSACASVPPAATDWIDVPLSANTWWEAPTGMPYREAEYRIPLAAGEALEHMLTLQEGAMVVYTWSSNIAAPGRLTAEFHGHTERVGEAPGTVMFYKMHQSDREAGTLKAPFSGVHGWYFKNESDAAIEVVLKAAGFFTD
jgi:hypothetical protein